MENKFENFVIPVTYMVGYAQVHLDQLTQFKKW